MGHDEDQIYLKEGVRELRTALAVLKRFRLGHVVYPEITHCTQKLSVLPNWCKTLLDTELRGDGYASTYPILDPPRRGGGRPLHVSRCQSEGEKNPKVVRRWRERQKR